MKTLKRILSASKCKLLLRHASAILGMATLLCVSSYNVQAQKVKNLGKVSAFQQLLSSEDPQLKSTRKEASKIFKIATTGSSLSAYINVHTRQGATEGFIGSVEGSPSATVYFNFKDGKVDGKAILIKEKKAFVYTTNAKGEVEVQQQPLDKAICTEYPIKSSKGVVHTSIAPAPPAGSTAYTLESLPGAQAVLMLDFDGEYVVNTRWNGGAVIDAQPTDYTEAEITGIWQLVSEDFRVFNVNVTTNNTVFLAADRFRRMKCIFTPTNQINPLWGGVAYPYSFFVDNDDPCWVFNYGVKPAAETASHELGHTFGLSHDGRSNPAEDYYSGTANWAPIMGNSMYSQPSHWSLGEYANANNLEDDIDMIANYPISGTTSGVGFRTDEAGNTLATAKLLVYDGAGDISPSQNVGIITTRTDVDIYYFNSTGGTASINLSATMPPHPDLDVALTLKNSNGTTITTANPATSLDASFVTVLPAGKYYVIVDGIGNGDPQGTGYSDYSSIGQYKITGNIIANTPPQVTLNAGSPVVNYYGTRYVTAGSLFELFTSPTDVEGPIAKVEFYQNDVKIGEDAFYPGHSWYVSNLAAGTYVFKAKAFDQGGLTTWSEPITIIVDGTAPTVSITSPANNATFTTPANFEVGTYPTDGQGPIRKVEFYQNNVLVGYDDLYPSFSYYAYNLAAGTYTYTAKAYDIAGNNTTSAPITVTVTAACAVNEVTPPASQFVVRNAWSDQNYGSTVINESAALKIVQRAYGNSDLWVLESGKTFSVTSGQTYNIKFDYKDYAPIGVHGIEVGFATGINNTNTAPILSGTPVSFPAGYSSSTFTTKSVNLTASATATVFLAIKLKWNNQPNSTLSTYLKNLKVCSGASTQSRLEAADEETSLQGITLNPNPSAFTFTTEVQRDLNTIHVADLQGRIVYMGKSMSKDSILSFGEDFNAGIYIVHVQYADGTQESFKIVKSK